MASGAQVVANRLNAQKATGPRMDAGKAKAAQNAVRHGLLAQQAVIRGEDPGQFEFYRDQMHSELSPAGAMESIGPVRTAARRHTSAATASTPGDQRPPYMVS